MKGQLWTSDEIDFLKEFYPILRGYEILEILNRTKISVVDKAHRLGIKSQYKSINNSCKNYTLNEKFFEKPNILNSYWAGFIAADGTIMNNRQCLRFHLQLKDKNHIEKFLEQSQCTAPIKVCYEKRNNKTHGTTYVSISSKTLVKDLFENFGIKEKKSNREILPKLSIENTKAFVLGYIDGDGYIGDLSKYGRKGYRINICGSKKLLTSIKSFLNKHYKLESTSKVKKDPTGNIHIWETGGEFLIPFLKDFKNIQVPKLERKWKKII